jgi:hypothetical chaperone protein
MCATPSDRYEGPDARPEDLLGSTEVGGRALRYSDLLASFIGGSAAGRGQAALRPAVFGRPVLLVDDNPAADRRAQDPWSPGGRFRWAEVSFQFEPIGAALHYEASLAAKSWC